MAMADDTADRRRNSRRISFNEEALQAQTAAAASLHASQENQPEPSKIDLAWEDARKDEDGLICKDDLATILEMMFEVPRGAPLFLSAQSYLADKAQLTKRDFAIVCGELEDWLLMTPEQQDTAIANGNAVETLPESILMKLTAFFNKLDVDDDKEITREEAISHWGKNFAKINAEAMFNEVDVDKDGKVTIEEWYEFWQNVLKHGYTAEEVEEELDELVEGGSWVDFNDGRTT